MSLRLLKTESKANLVLKLYRDQDWGEYLIKVYEYNILVSTFHTDCKDDAVNTFNYILESQPCDQS